MKSHIIRCLIQIDVINAIPVSDANTSHNLAGHNEWIFRQM